jgi:hypothetical protein
MRAAGNSARCHDNQSPGSHDPRSASPDRAKCPAGVPHSTTNPQLAHGTSGATHEAMQRARRIATALLLTTAMTDTLFLLVTVVFFAISVAYTRGLDRI